MIATYDAYRQRPGISWSTLKHGRRSAKALKWALDHPDEGDTTSRMVLRANHAATLEPEYFALDFAIWKGGDRRGKEWAAFEAAHPTQTIVKESEYLAALAIKRAIAEHPEAGKLIANGLTEHAIGWTDKETGIRCKGRLDVYRPGSYIADVKGNEVDDLAMMWRATDLLYYGQLAWYQMGVEALTGDTLPCYLIPYEQRSPHEVAVFHLDDNWLEPGRTLCRRLLRMYADCTASGAWPGKYQRVQEMPDPPSRVIDDLDWATDGPITD